MNNIATCSRQLWNKGKLVAQKTPLRLRDIRAIGVMLQIAERTRDLALFDLAIDSKLRACDLTKLRVYRRTKNLRAVQLLLGHTKVRYLGIEVDDALEMAEQTEV
ncbi:hypothetical protein [Pseudomonas lurida]|jgi:hypothetical protein|uniref:hypothetical protein n=1 Tax=Pseudomonas lurida TaxID=244566 RepID=UPI0016549B95|nr:hypothetical protein [Pseudomonas lurida]MBC3921307.1 hypothetical protein [Pseudomonas lurida]